MQWPAESNSQAIRDEADALLERWAPIFAQEVSASHPERDRPMRVNFDGDWDARNNWRHLSKAHRQQDAIVYVSSVLTDTHAYLTYTLFYPRDWTPFLCVAYICHDNDLEVALVVVKRGSTPERAEVAYVETKAHRSYVALGASELARDDTGRPIIEVESGGHGMYPVRLGHAPEGAREYFEPGVRAHQSLERGTSAHRQAYALESMHESLWARRSVAGRLWTNDESFLDYTGARFGRCGDPFGTLMASEHFAGGVRPPWGLKASVGNRGDWFLDPEYVALRSHPKFFPQHSASTKYVLNPYLDDLARECVGPKCGAAFRVVRGSVPLGTASGVLAAIGLLSLGAPRRVRSRVRQWFRCKFARRIGGPK